MTRFSQTTILCCITLTLIGCNGAEKDEPIWEQVKITDLASPNGSKDSSQKLLKTINFTAYTLEMPPENMTALDQLRQMLHSKPLRFKNRDSFNANSLSARFGTGQMLNETNYILGVIGAKKTKTTSLLLSDGQPDYIAIATLKNEQSLLYNPAIGSTEILALKPGLLALRIKAEKIPGSKGTCHLDLLPVLLSPPKTSRQYTDESSFAQCRFGAKISPGDFLLLTPEKYTTSRQTLAGLLFSKPGKEPLIKIYLLVCTKITD